MYFLKKNSLSTALLKEICSLNSSKASLENCSILTLLKASLLNNCSVFCGLLFLGYFVQFKEFVGFVIGIKFSTASAISNINTCFKVFRQDLLSWSESLLFHQIDQICSLQHPDHSELCTIKNAGCRCRVSVAAKKKQEIVPLHQRRAMGAKQSTWAIITEQWTSGKGLWAWTTEQWARGNNR